MFRWKLLSLLTLCHLLALTGIGLAWLFGWLDQAIETDTLYLVRINAALCFVGAATATWWGWWLSRELDGALSSKTRLLQDRLLMEDGRTTLLPEVAFEAFRDSIAIRIDGVRQWAERVEMFGLIGTIIGFVIAANAAMQMDTLGDPAQAGGALLQFIGGMGLALYKTLAGAIFATYLRLLYRILEVAAAHVVSRAVGEVSDARG